MRLLSDRMWGEHVVGKFRDFGTVQAKFITVFLFFFSKKIRSTYDEKHVDILAHNDLLCIVSLILLFHLYVLQMYLLFWGSLRYQSTNCRMREGRHLWKHTV